jgi:hypothetical protein
MQSSGAQPLETIFLWGLQPFSLETLLLFQLLSSQPVA